MIIKIEVEDSDAKQIEEIFRALIKVGGLTGVKNGSTNIHFDRDGLFQSVRLDYYPWQRRHNGGII